VSGDEPIAVRTLEGQVSYADGSEQRILGILNAAADRSSGSDELAAAITDWPSRYHLSPSRTNLLRPLRLGPGLRILEIGAGTGVLSRFLGESGARVVALEGQADRARAAAIRCAGLPSVEVVCGSLESFSDPGGFDLVCIVGVLEYAASGAGGAETHQDFLARAAALLRPGGALLVAIENQIGLKYLLGYREDHLGLPWIGIEGYPGDHGIRTFPRRVLSRMLDAVGLPAQTWLYPFPDYKLPAVVLADALYDLDEAPRLVDQLVRHPATDDAGERSLLCDDRRAHQVLLEAGLGREVANSFLVVAAAEGSAPGFLPDPGVLAWHLGGNRRRAWRRHLELRSSSSGLTIRSFGAGSAPAAHREGWLDHDPVKDGRYVLGRTVEDLALEACRRRDRGALEAALLHWRRFLDSRAVKTADAGAEPHPFRVADAGPRLPPEYLDVALSNLVVGDDGLHFIDHEWRASGGVTARLVMARALWLLAMELVRHGVEHPWPDATTVRQLTASLCELGGLGAGDDIVDRLLPAEVELQHLVTGRDRAALRDDLRWLAGRSRANSEVTARLPFTELRGRVEDLQRQRDEQRRRFEALEAESRRREHELNHSLGEMRESGARLRGDLAVAHEQLDGTLRELGAHARELASARAELEMWRGWRESFDRKLPVRIYHALRRLLGR
jgi:SAM-dependent methyltransferase